MDFQYTDISLNDAYELSYRHALETIRRNGGEIKGDRIRIPIAEPEVLPLEQNFPGYRIREKVPVDLRVLSDGRLRWEWTFDGAGVVLRGKTGNLDFQDEYALVSPEETLNFHEVEVEFYLDGEADKKVSLPLHFIERAHELFFRYELSPGPHTLEMRVTDIAEKAYLDIWDMLVYEKPGNGDGQKAPVSH